MNKIYLIAGIGADTRVYNNIDLHGYEAIPVDWIEPDSRDTLAMYAQKLIYQYHIAPNSVVIGNSLGGMIAIEIAKQVPLDKVILISSIKTIDEAPGYFGFFRRVPVYRIIPKKLYSSLGFLIELVFGEMNSADKALFKDMLAKSSAQFLRWAMDAALSWDNTTQIPDVYHITGDKHLIFNYKKIKNVAIVKGGTHIMIFDKAKEINKLLRDILKKK